MGSVHTCYLKIVRTCWLQIVEHSSQRSDAACGSGSELNTAVLLTVPDSLFVGLFCLRASTPMGAIAPRKKCLRSAVQFLAELLKEAFPAEFSVAKLLKGNY